MPAVVAIESNPEALIVPFTEIGAGIEHLPPQERTGFVDQGLLDCLQPQGMGIRRGLLTEDLPFSNLGAVLESGLEVKGGKGGEAPRPRREDFETVEEYAEAYGNWLSENKGADKQTVGRVKAGIKEPWTWKKGHPGDRE